MYEIVFSLCYTRGDGLHGSGLSFTRSDVHAMTLSEANYHIERLGKQRAAEAAELRKGARQGRRRRR